MVGIKKLLLALVAISLTGVASARSPSIGGVIGKHRLAISKHHLQQLTHKLAVLAIAQRALLGQGEITAQLMSAGDRRMWVRASHMNLMAWQGEGGGMPLPSKKMRLGEHERKMYEQLLLAIGSLSDAVKSRLPKMVFYDEGSSRGGSMPDYGRGGSSSGHPSSIDRGREPSGPDARPDGPVDSPPSKDKGTGPDERPSK